ncbi:carboxypeptidase cpdS-like [Teratosphaeria destructans]|uniref:Carboxypeptidase n=1 Tax=Teratosphaeria destructans TaxID=418781 RepID=A0A9W7W6Z2_9PEZI|nr:carboxypeptidase cpdS-like [Teratosphaeria destructans]
MHLPSLLVGLIGLTSVAALRSPHRRAPLKAKRSLPVPDEDCHTAKGSNSTFLTSKSAKFAVNGSGIPEVDFDIGESYAGRLSTTSNQSDENALFFWFFPSENPAATNEITIWLNGGPGCSSLDGLLQENGPFLWQSGTYRPVRNPYSWTNLTNMVYVDQPIGTGLSSFAPGAPAKITNEKDVADYFKGFWKNFIDTFDLHNAKVYITGESYAGQYIPYLAYYFLETNDTEYYNVKGIQINDASINEDDVLLEAPSAWFLQNWQNIFNLNETTYNDIIERATNCGYISFMEQALTFPPTGKLGNAPNSSLPGCDVWDDILAAAVYINPCFNIYHIIDYCPYLWDELGFPSLGTGPNDYFNRSDVQKALHVPPTDYSVCGDDTLGLSNPGDMSPPSSFHAIPAVIEQTNNVIIGHGTLDFLLQANGSLATIQNMTWNGKQGFQTQPSDNFFVPYHPGLAEILYDVEYQPSPAPSVSQIAGAGYLGITHTERGLTFVTVDHAGHEIPQYVPGAAYRQLEFLLGRIPSLTSMGDFTTQRGNFTGSTPPSR